MTNIDISRWPQKVRIEWEMLTPSDDSTTRPDERDEGFWPSLASGSCGFCDCASESEFEALERAATDRMAAWEAGEWEFVGVIAKATVYIPIGGNSFRIMTLQSGGLWGIESDAGAYLNDVFEEEKVALQAELKTLGQAIAS